MIDTVQIRFGFIRSFDGDSYTASVELLGYPGTLLLDVPVAYSLREDLLVDGTRCVILMADELDAQTVVVALYGGKPADDPRFDPVVGHKHRGLLGDGPKLE